MMRDYYERILDELGRDELERYDREESGAQWRGIDEATQDNGAFTFSKLDRDKQVAILHAIDVNLPTRTKRPNKHTATSYGIKHAVERYTGFYTSNLQAKVAFRVLGYQRSKHQLNPFYNISIRDWNAFDRLSRKIANERWAA